MAALVLAFMVGRVSAQVTATGPHAAAIGVVNGNVTVVNGSNKPELRQLAASLNRIKSQGKLNTSELQVIIDSINQSIIPNLNSIKDDTSYIREVLERVNIAADHPDTARDVLRPFMKPAFDLSNSSYTASAFLDVNGEPRFKLVFSVIGSCEVFIDPPEGAGFTVDYGILSDHDTVIFSNLLGSQPRYPPVRLSTGIYQFRMKASRGAGQYTSTISARCR